MSEKRIPKFFQQLQAESCIKESDIVSTQDGFFLVYKSLSDILAEKNIHEFLDKDGIRNACNRFFDDWFLYAVSNKNEDTYSLVKFREQEHDAEEDGPADGDAPGVTISFISLNEQVLLDCLKNATDENRTKLSTEINRVVAYRRQLHHRALKEYFVNPKSEGAYLAAFYYAKQIATFAENGRLPVPDCYRKIVQESRTGTKDARISRIPNFIEALNEKAWRVVCDDENIYINDKTCPDEYEQLAILATHTGNTSLYSFAAEVEFHARFLTPFVRIKVPLLKKSLYDSAIRADMTIDEVSSSGFTPYYKEESKLVRRQYELHGKNDMDRR